MFEICPEAPEDESEVEALYDLCFAPGRTALSSYRLRDGVARVADLCLVLRDQGGILLAAIRFWPVRIGDERALLLGPIAVHPTAQGEGLGAILMRDSLERARHLRWSRVLLVGDLPYYQRFGFHKLESVIMPPPTNPDRVLGLELRPGAWVDLTGPVLREDAQTAAGLAETATHSHMEPECTQVAQSGKHADESQSADGSSADQ
ncbi:Predicted N-acetyltransferase YhbS [Paracoccus alcaliphilus]|uniref:Predicted N-acetyltransferase YhbS n=1 Tax=Paracoccus alcaliphilus TaxID=34002 RepID=A0A1H8J8H5_9RHOB|nr:N-acetyltransferase [Paracoccus alcaliphilus]WCR17137.1 N-acetyltransferase [Paracoccus alcaliphilus]SEN76979.1 Predicted N-acetyltransferase YhbS [Paracoccus alcaliphilus]